MLFSDALLWLVSLSLSGWLYLLLGRDGFWLARPTLDRAPPPRHEMPDVVAVVPARNEAAYVRRSLRSLLARTMAAGSA
jgi:cellulose synthase/poly-beta-1,6-N-acetylglucosamine synthase-like glycosyltransferase